VRSLSQPVLGLPASNCWWTRVFELKWLFLLDVSMVYRRLHDGLRKIYLHLKAPRFDLRRPHRKLPTRAKSSENGGKRGKLKKLSCHHVWLGYLTPAMIGGAHEQDIIFPNCLFCYICTAFPMPRISSEHLFCSSCWEGNTDYTFWVESFIQQGFLSNKTCFLVSHPWIEVNRSWICWCCACRCWKRRRSKRGQQVILLHYFFSILNPIFIHCATLVPKGWTRHIMPTLVQGCRPLPYPR
jgi:hypothetical protein